MPSMLPQLLILAIFIIAMYFFLIRPQRKKEKNIEKMRANLQVGDEIITIGGICGKIVKKKEDTIVIQVGADKVKFEMTKWSVSTVVNPKKETKKPEEKEEKTEKKPVPKRLKKVEKKEEPAPEAVEDKETEKKTENEGENRIIEDVKERMSKIRENEDASRDTEKK